MLCVLPCDILPVEDAEPKLDPKKASNTRTRQKLRADLNPESEDSEDKDEHEMVLMSSCDEGSWPSSQSAKQDNFFFESKR